MNHVIDCIVPRISTDGLSELTLYNCFPSDSRLDSGLINSLATKAATTKLTKLLIAGLSGTCEQTREDVAGLVIQVLQA